MKKNTSQNLMNSFNYKIMRYLQQIFHIYTAAICTPLNSYHTDLLWKKNMKKGVKVKALKAKSNVTLSQFYMTFISKIDRYDSTHFDFVKVHVF